MKDTKLQETLGTYRTARREEREAYLERVAKERAAQEAGDRHRAAKTALDNAKAALDRALDAATAPVDA